MKTLRILPALFAAMLALAPLAHAATASSDDAEREQEARERAQERDERLYDEGTDALDDHDWSRAAKAFRKAAAMNAGHADASLYWLAYAQNKLGQRSEALETLVQLQKSYAKSRWNEDAKTLEVEIRQGAGQTIEPKNVTDEEVKIMALNGLVNTDPERATPLLRNILDSRTASDRLKDRALFVLSQSRSPQALELLAKVAKDSSAPTLQSRALRYMGIMGGEESRRLLADVYASTNDVNIKQSILKSYMVANDRAHLLTLAKTEKNDQLRAVAVQQLGLLAAREELSQLYATESDIEVRKAIIKAMFLGNSVDKLGEIARTEKNDELRAAAIKNLGLLGGTRTSAILTSLYATETNVEVKKSIIKSLFIQNNAKALVDLARREQNAELKREIVSKLSIMNSREAADYLMEFLKD